MLWKKDKLFCEINPACYAISVQKEILKRHLQNLRSKECFAKKIIKRKLPNLVYEHHSHLIKKGKGIDQNLQQNKAVNIGLACEKLNGLIINPGEVFSFWGLIGNTTKRKGYKEGRVIEKNRLKPGMGGGLCNQWVCNGIFITYRVEKFSDRSRAGSWKYSGSYITAVCCSGGGPCKTGNFTTNDRRDGNRHNPVADSDAVYVQSGTGNRAVIFVC